MVVLSGEKEVYGLIVLGSDLSRNPNHRCLVFRSQHAHVRRQPMGYIAGAKCSPESALSTLNLLSDP